MNDNNQNRPWGLTLPIITSLIVAAGFIITQITTASVYISYRFGEVSPARFEELMGELQYNGTVISLCTFATLIVCSTMVLLAIKMENRLSLKNHLAFSIATLAQAKYWFFLTIILMIVSDLLSLLLDKPVVPEYMHSVYTSAEPLWLLWAALIIAAPIFEELFFRGYLITCLAYSVVGPIGAIIISAAFWAVVHIQYDIYGLLTIFVIGLLLGAARLKTGSLPLTMAMHAMINLAAVIQVAYVTANSVH